MATFHMDKPHLAKTKKIRKKHLFKRLLTTGRTKEHRCRPCYKVRICAASDNALTATQCTQLSTFTQIYTALEKEYHCKMNGGIIRGSHCSLQEKSIRCNKNGLHAKSFPSNLFNLFLMKHNRTAAGKSHFRVNFSFN